MRILSVSDKVEPVLHGPFIRERVGKVDLLLACGDLPYEYLEYIVSLLDVPLYYVHGNHDRPLDTGTWNHGSYAPKTTLGWGHDLHQRTANHAGLLLAGLEGCRRYKMEAPFQYSEAETRRQVQRLSLRLLVNRLRHGRFLDILITHAPARGIHDDTDWPHQGFDSYLALLRRFQPTLMIHGHQHVYDRNAVTETFLRDTLIINTYGYRLIELEPLPGRRGWRQVAMSH